MQRLGPVLRNAIFAFACLVAVNENQSVARADTWNLPLAQVANPPLPPNVSQPARMYVVEGIVVVVLFAGAVFAVCRSSGRS